MAGDDDERSLLNHKGNRCGDGFPIGICVGFVQHLHTDKVDFTDFKDNGQKLIHTPVLADRKQSFGNKLIHALIGIAQNTGMISVGGHTTDAKQNQRFQAADILVGIPYLRHIIIVIPAAGRSAFAAEGDELFFFRMYFINQRFKGNVVKPNMTLTNKIAEKAHSLGIKIHKGTIMTTEVFGPYVDDQALIDRAPSDLDILGEEMETFALIHVANSFNREAAVMATATDSKFSDKILSSEERQTSLNDMIKLGLESLI